MTAGEFNVTVNGLPYFFGQEPWFQEGGSPKSPATGTLKLTGVDSGNAGVDGFGS